MTRADDENEAVARLQAGHLQATLQRRIILRTLMQQRAAISARALCAALHAGWPAIGQATVYRTLELLVEVGAATRFLQGNNESAYVYCPPYHHSHLVCTCCGLVEDVEGCLLLPRLVTVLEARTKFQIHAHVVTLSGRCAACQVREQTRRGTGAEASQGTASLRQPAR